MKTNVYLSGGGTKCCYQPLFIKNLEENKEIEIKNIIGISFGSLIGYMSCRGLHDEMIEFCKTLTPNSLIPCSSVSSYMMHLADNIKSFPYIGLPIGNMINTTAKTIWLLTAIKNKGFFIPQFGEDFLDKYTSIGNTDNLKKFWCVVYNVTKKRLEVINGTHPLIEKYVAASCALWTIFPPIFIEKLITECECDSSCNCKKNNEKYICINNITITEKYTYCTCDKDDHRMNEYIDPGFDRCIPYDIETKLQEISDVMIINDRDIDIICMSNSGSSTFESTGSNLIEYLDNLIHTTSDVIQQNRILYEWQIHNTPITTIEGQRSVKTYILNYDSKIKKSIDVDSEVINKIINDGNKVYTEFNNHFQLLHLHLQNPIFVQVAS